MPSAGNVPRPLRTTEYYIQFASREAEKGWRDLVATSRNAAVTAWEFLTTSPTQSGIDCYRLQDALATVTIDKERYDRWQYKVTSGGRIWYAVIPPDRRSKKPGLVLLERVTTGHPNETIKNRR